jgi:ElaB/YqjD/DUF883 family membrane-anchored ribosome-binding protein
MDQIEETQAQAEQILQLQERLTELMPTLIAVLSAVVLVAIVKAILEALRRRKINKAILDTQLEVREIKSMLIKQSSSYLSNTSTPIKDTPVVTEPQKTDSSSTDTTNTLG